MGSALACVLAATAVASVEGPPVAAAIVAPSPPEASIVAPPPDVAAGERSDARVDGPPPRAWRVVPMVLLFPFRLLTWAIEYPAGGLLKLEDRYHWMQRTVDALTWSGGTRGLRPAFYYSTIMIPELGAHYFDHRTLGIDTRLGATATVGGANYVYGDLVVEPTRTTARTGLIMEVSFDRRGDLLYNGLGNHTYSDAPTGRYLMNGLEGHIRFRARPTDGLALFVIGTSGFKRFGNGDRVGGDQGIIYSFDTTTIAGFSDGTTYVRGGVGFDLDTRDSPLGGATGIVVRGAFDYTHGIDKRDSAGYERVSGLVGVPINFWARTHILWLSAATSIAFPNGGVDVPFSELPTLGGPNDLRGFRFQDFRDYSSFYATAEYRWPVWMWVDGALFVDYGGVFGKNYAGFGATRMQPDVGLALRLVTSNRFLVRANIGYGFGEGVNFSLAGMSP